MTDLRLALCLVALLAAAPAKADMFSGEQLNGQPIVNTWKALRDFRIVKQQLDYSCGAASMATILNEFYGMSVTEKDVLTRMGATDRSSFQQLADVAPAYGVRAGGLMLSCDDPRQFTIPKDIGLAQIDETFFTQPRGWSLSLRAIPLSP
jgi:predicted double-glycine peptidase